MRAGRWRHPGWGLSIGITAAAVALPLLLGAYLWELHDYGLDSLDSRRGLVRVLGNVTWLAPAACAILPFWVRGRFMVPAMAAVATAGALALMAQLEDSFGSECMDMCPMPRFGILAAGTLSVVVGLVAAAASLLVRARQGSRRLTA